MLKRLSNFLPLFVIGTCLCGLPHSVQANTGTPPSLVIAQSETPSKNPVAVGDASSGPNTTVSYSVDISSGNEQNEAGRVSIQSQHYTIDAGSGVITGVAVPEGYTVTIASDGHIATINGSGESSFHLSPTIYYPPSATGTNGVSCSGYLKMSDNSTVSGNTGSASVIAVKVDSVDLAIAPSSVKIGQTLKRSDFTITTTPSDKGDYKYADGTYLVAFPSSLTVRIGDNPAKAKCGVSSALETLVGVIVSASWDENIKANAESSEVEVQYSASVQGDSETTAKVTISGPLSAVSGDTNPTIVSGKSFQGDVWLQDLGENTGSTPEILTVDASEGEGAINTTSSSIPADPMIALASRLTIGKRLIVGGYHVAKKTHKTTTIYFLPKNIQIKGKFNVQLVPAPGTSYADVVTGKAALSCVSQVWADGNGWGEQCILLKWWTDQPSATVNIGTPSHGQVKENLGNGKYGPIETFHIGADIHQPPTKGTWAGYDITNQWNGPNAAHAGAVLAIFASSSAPGNTWDITSADGTAYLEEPAGPNGVLDQSWLSTGSRASAATLKVTFAWF